MSQPQVLSDAKGPYYIGEDGVTMRVNAAGNAWEPEAPAPAPIPVPAPAPASVMPQPVMPTAAVAPQPVMPTAAPQPAPQPVMQQPVMQQPVMQSPVDSLNAAMNQPAAGGASDLNFLVGDLTGVNDNSFAVIPAGTTVNCVVEEVELTEAKSDGKPMMKIVFSVVDAAYKGKKIWDYIKLDESTRWKFKSLCRATGLLSPDESKFVGSSVMDFKGRRLALKVKVEEYNGSESNKVSGSYEMYNDGQVPAAAPIPGAPVWPQA